MIINNPFGIDPIDYLEDTSADRVGRRIRKIRTSIDLSQSELGEKVNLSADRIQKYENGIRKPKTELLKEIACALGVETLALTDPNVSSSITTMYALFEMEEKYGIVPTEINGDIYLKLDATSSVQLSEYTKEWINEIKQRDLSLSIANSEEEKKQLLQEYSMWKWTFPRALADKSSVNSKKTRIKNKIKELEEELKKLESNE